MEINQEILDRITQMAGAAFTPAQIGFALGFKREEFKAMIANEESTISIAYFKGFYSSELSIRESAFQLARNGSSPAQTLALKQFDETRKTLIQDGTSSEEI